MTTTTRTDRSLETIGESALESIREMVAALEADRERLEELRDEREGWEADEDGGQAAWEEAEPEDAAELAELIEAVTLDGEEVDEETAQQRIREDALSVEVRSGWASLGEDLEAEEYCILLTTGGPAVRIVGDLDGGQPSTAQLEVQDWGTPWTLHSCDDCLLTYANCFYFVS